MTASSDDLITLMTNATASKGDLITLSSKSTISKAAKLMVIDNLSDKVTERI
jgi:hypothetical protein